jgi:hypothetical protein
MQVSIEVETKDQAILIAYYLFDKAGDIEQTATRWGASDGTDGDEVDLALRAEAAMLTKVAKSISKQIKNFDALQADAVNS